MSSGKLEICTLFAFEVRKVGVEGHARYSGTSEQGTLWEKSFVSCREVVPISEVIYYTSMGSKQVSLVERLFLSQRYNNTLKY